MKYLAGLMLVIITCGVFIMSSCSGGSKLGIFSEQADIGKISLAGNGHFNAKNNEYVVSGSGENIWGTEDAFHFMYTRTSGDLVMKTKVNWPADGKNQHRKAGWMVRAGLEADAPYADVAVHGGDGLVSLQYRKTKGGPTLEVKSPLTAPLAMRLEKTGSIFSLYVSQNDSDYIPVGSIVVEMSDSVYAGLFVCSHDSTVLETAVFSAVEFSAVPAVADENRVVESTLEIFNIETRQRRVVYSAKDHFEAPNWTKDGQALIFNSKGLLYTIPVTGGAPVQINTGAATQCNNDHGLSPDGAMLAISSQHDGGKSIIYTLPVTGGDPMQVTPLAPSYWHGWSPDGKTLAYCAERNGEYDVYTIPVGGGQEKRLTTAPGLDDGPEYSPDGKYIYFNSVRTGLMKIWRMRADGREQTQITFGEEYGDWFAHPSPDNQWLVFVCFDKTVEGHPMNKEVVLRMMPVKGGEPEIIVHLFGGQGTINVPSWSPDSREFAFVSYRPVNP